MTVIIPSGYVQVALNYTGTNFFSGRAATVLGFEVQGAEITELGEVAAAVAASWIEHIGPQTDTQVTLDTVRVVTETAAGELSVATAGGADLQDTPPQVATLVRYSTPVRGRRGRGRSYLPGLLASTHVSTQGIISTPRLEVIQGIVDSFFEQLATDFSAQLGQVILQHTTPTGPSAPENPSPPLDPPPAVASRSVDSRVATQRRRLRG
jgi:hypothetical protein